MEECSEGGRKSYCCLFRYNNTVLIHTQKQLTNYTKKSVINKLSWLPERKKVLIVVSEVKVVKEVNMIAHKLTHEENNVI